MDKQKFAMQSSDPEPEDANARLQSPPVEMKKQTAVQSFDAEPAGAHCGNARSQSPPAEQVRTNLTNAIVQ
ncbi:TPA: hypothetical protein ACH3X3_003482 [Trebouxia sp. C0006]